MIKESYFVNIRTRIINRKKVITVSVEKNQKLLPELKEVNLFLRNFLEKAFKKMSDMTPCSTSYTSPGGSGARSYGSNFFYFSIAEVFLH